MMKLTNRNLKLSKRKPLKLYWVELLSRFQVKKGNGELEFRSLRKRDFADAHYQSLLNNVLHRNSITSSEYIALHTQRAKEIEAEIQKRQNENKP